MFLKKVEPQSKKGKLHLITDQANKVQIRDGRYVESWAQRPTFELYTVKAVGDNVKNLKEGDTVVAPKTSCPRPWIIDGENIFRCRHEGIAAKVPADTVFSSSWEKEADYDEKKPIQEDLIVNRKFSAQKTVSKIDHWKRA